MSSVQLIDFVTCLLTLFFIFEDNYFYKLSPTII